MDSIKNVSGEAYLNMIKQNIHKLPNDTKQLKIQKEFLQVYDSLQNKEPVSQKVKTIKLDIRG